MKRLSVVLLALTLLIPSANAAVIAKPLVILAQVDIAASGLVLSGSQILVYGNREKNGFAQLINGSVIDLNCGVESFVSAGTSDFDGNIYLVGAASNPIVGTLPTISGVLNPDNVQPDPVSSNKSDATTLCLWKLDSTGKLIDISTMDISNAVIPYSLIVDKFGVTIAGANYADPGFNSFLVNWNEKPIYLGEKSTRIFSIARGADGSTIAVGQSAEKLLNKPVRGRADGFLARISNGKITSIQRSSDLNSTRAWRSATANLFLGGNSNTTAVITKFDNKFNPTWTDRYPSNGSALTASAGKLNYGVFYSTGLIKALPSWKRKGAILLLTFDSKGGIASASYLNAPSSTQLNALAANSALGAIILASGFIYRA